MKPNPDNTDKTKESFIWHAGDEFAGWLIPDGDTNYEDTVQTFVIDKDYSNDEPSKSASFDCTNFPTATNYKMLAVYPKDNFTLPNGGDVFTVTIPNPQTQTGGNNTYHLATSMNMYAATTVNANSQVPGMTFKHLASLFRFTVTNKNATDCRITTIQVESAQSRDIFGTNYTLKVADWDKGTIDSLCTAGANTITQALQDSLVNSLGIELPAASEDKPSSLEAYTTVGPNPNPNTLLSGDELIFKITVTDLAGGNPRVYTSLAVDAQRIIDKNGGATTWQPGKRYWFKLLLDNELTVTLKEVTLMGDGWNNEVEL